MTWLWKILITSEWRGRRARRRFEEQVAPSAQNLRQEMWQLRRRDTGGKSGDPREFYEQLKLFLASSNGEEDRIRVMEDAKEARINAWQQLDSKEGFQMLFECDTSNQLWMMKSLQCSAKDFRPLSTKPWLKVEWVTSPCSTGRRKRTRASEDAVPVTNKKRKNKLSLNFCKYRHLGLGGSSSPWRLKVLSAKTTSRNQWNRSSLQADMYGRPFSTPLWGISL
jgi:hypothetical protein